MKFSKVRQRLFKQRRFRHSLIALVAAALFLGVWIVHIEKQVGNIKTVSDGLWWAASTVTAVGYGDRYPVTDQGRVIGVLLEVLGAVTMGVIIALIGSSMNRSQEEYYWNRLFERINELETEIQSLRKQTGFIVKQTDDPSSDAPDSLD
jgi:hypothetical protein